MFQALHGFSNAFSVAYKAVMYLRRVHSDNSITMTFVTAKAHVLPLKLITIPKAEQIAAYILTRLLIRVAEILDIPAQFFYAWSDSEIVLHWLAKNPSSLER